MHRHKGFTLIELMVVVAIIAVLAAILVPNFIRSRAQSQLVVCETNERDVDLGLEMYASENSGNYPPPNGSTLPDPSTHNWSRFMLTNPVCPTNLAPYVYATGATNTAFSLSQGPASAAPHSIVGIPANYPQYWSNQGLMP